MRSGSPSAAKLPGQTKTQEGTKRRSDPTKNAARCYPKRAPACLVDSGRLLCSAGASSRSAVAEWTIGIGPTSSSRKVTAHPAFRRIVGMGREAVPYFLREVKRKPSLLVRALQEITGESPVPRESRGRISEIAKAWVAWGEKNGLLQ
jgi:hypothetical protein